MTLNLSKSLKADISNALTKIEDVLKITLGPLGRNVLIKENGQDAVTINDGSTIIHSLQFEDRLTNIICQLLQEVARNTNDEVGDGTTSSVVIATNLAKNIIKFLQPDTNIYEVIKGVDRAYKDIETELIKRAQIVKDIYKVALISTGQNEELSRLIEQAFSSSEGIPTITIEESKGTNSDISIVQGLELENGYTTPYMCNNEELQITELENCLLLLVDGEIKNVQELLPFLEFCATEKRQGLIIAESIDSQPLDLLIQNFYRGVTDVHFVKVGSVGQTRSDILQDIASMSGTRVIDKQFESIQEAGIDLGVLSNVRISKKNTILMGPNDENVKSNIRNRVHQIEREIEEATTDYLKDTFKRRLSNLAGSIVKIRVGAYTEAELIDKKLRLEDAVNACRVAIEQGIVPGAGASLFIELPKPDNLSEDALLGYNALKEACKMIFFNVMLNSGLNPSEFSFKLNGYNSVNLKENRISDNPFDEGIIDPVKVILSSIKFAKSIACEICTTEGVVYNN